jgi:CHAT domain-containing protein/Tfp pilus assembly protein PilF
MTLRRRVNVLAIFLLSGLLTCFPTSGVAQNDEQATVRRVVEQFFAGFQQKDLMSLMASWSQNSPDFLSARRSIQESFFTNYRTIAVKSLRLNQIYVETNKATVELVAELSVVGTQADASATPLQMSRKIQLVKETGGWKIWKYTSPEDELAVALGLGKTPEERDALLKSQADLVTPELVKSLNKHSRELSARGKLAEALMILDLALNIAQRLDDKRDVVVALRWKGEISRLRGDYQGALKIYDEALRLAEELKIKSLSGSILNSIAIVHTVQSDYPKALALFQQSLAIREELGDKLEIAIELLNIGNVYVYQGEKVRALEVFERGLKYSEDTGNKSTASAILNGIGNVYFSQGNYEQAAEYIHRGLKIKQEIGDKLAEGRMLGNLGVVYSRLGQYEKSLDYLHQNAKIREEFGDKLGTVETLHYIASTYLLKGDYAAALTYAQKALVPAEAMGLNEMQAQILHNIGESNLRLGQYQAASDYAARAASLAAQGGLPDILWKAKTIAGSAYLGLNQPQLARQHFQESITTVEKLRTLVVGGEREQQRFFESKVDPYQGMVQLSLAQNDMTQALSYAEQAKGRVLLDVLIGGRANITKAMTSEELKRDRELSAEIASLNTQLTRLKTRSKPPAAEVADIQTKLDKVRLEYEAFQTSLYTAHPELKVQRGQTEPLTLAEMAALLPDDQTAILEYVVTEDRTYLFVLRKAAPKDVRAELTAHTLNIKGSDLAQMAESFRKRLSERDLAIKEPASRLYDVLIKPAEGRLRGVRKLRIVPDGALWNVPFQALQQGRRGYLLENYTISYAPSLSVLREMERRPNAPRTESTLLAMGNPTLSRDTVAKVRVAHRDEPLTPLPDAEKEVNTLGRLYGRGSKVLTGQLAREVTVKDEAANFKILHFATHAILDDRNPLYSQIIFSQAENDKKEDGLLEAWELMKLDLNAELAVLSACETARGRIAAGEGIIGMSWALFVAGTPSAVVSQWKVDSARSSELMIEFHRNLLRKQGAAKTRLTKSEALRQAALKVFRSSYNHPAYWAGFILIGDEN